MSNKTATGEFVAQHLNDGDVKDRDIQPNGVDLTVGEIFRTSGSVRFEDDGDYSKPNRTKIELKYPDRAKALPYYSLVSGQYPIVYDEKIEIPEGYVGRVYPRSRLMRSGLHLTSALWDQGYEGVGEGLLQVPQSIQRVRVPVEMPIAQMVFKPAEEAKAYDGTHQQERLVKKTDGGYGVTD